MPGFRAECIQEGRPSMSATDALYQRDAGPDGAAPATPRPNGEGVVSPGALQFLLDQAASFQMIATPEQHSNVTSSPSEVTGIRVREVLRRFDAPLESPSIEGGVRASNRVGEIVGQLDL